MKKIYLTFTSLLFALLVVAEPVTFNMLLNPIKGELPKPKKKSKSRSVNPSITVQKSFIVRPSSDPGGGLQNGMVRGGSILDYSILLSTNQLTTGISLRDTLDDNLTYLPNSLKITPVSVDDAYQSVGNVGIVVDDAELGVLANDQSPDGKSLKVEPVTNGTTKKNGSFSINEDGTFVYNPKTGFSGTDTLTYTLKNSNNVSANELGLVSIVVSSPIYFVNSSAVTNGDGSLQNPFKNIANVTSTGSNAIFVYSGTYSGELTLDDNQKLIGQGAKESLTQILNITLPPFSNSLPNTLGENPKITSAKLNLSRNNELYGLDFSRTAGNVTMVSPKNDVTNIGNLKVRDVSLSTNGSTAIYIPNGGVLDCIFNKISVSNATKGLSVSNSTGKFEILGENNTAGSGGVFQNITDRGLEFVNVRNIVLKNINLTNANTSEGVAPSYFDNSSANAAIHFGNVIGIKLDNIQMNTDFANYNKGFGINLFNSEDFFLQNSKILRSGLGATGAGIYAFNTGGNMIISNSEIGKASRAAVVINRESTLNLSVLNSKFIDTRTLHTDTTKLNPEGQSAFSIETYGRAAVTANINSSKFLKYSTNGIQAYSNDNSGLRLYVSNSEMSSLNAFLPNGEDSGSGLDMAASGSSALLYFSIYNNIIKGRGAHLLNIVARSNGTVDGFVENNTLNYKNLNGVSNFGSGIRVSHASSSTLNRIKINQNLINGINDPSSFGIDVLANGPKQEGRIDVINTNNIVEVGASSSFAMRMSAAESKQKLCSKLLGNTVTKGEHGIVQLRSAEVGNVHYFEGLGTSGTTQEKLDVWWNLNANSPTADETNNILVEGLGTYETINACFSPTAFPRPNSFVEPNQEIQIAQIEEPLSEELNKKASEKSGSRTKVVSTPEVENIEGQIIHINGIGNGFSLPKNKTFTVTYSASVSQNPTSCTIPNKVTIRANDILPITSAPAIAQVALDIPTLEAVLPSIVCEGDTVQFKGFCSAGTVNWYKGTGLIGAGNSISHMPSPNVTYSAKCVLGGCESAPIAVPVLVNSRASITLYPTAKICKGKTFFSIPYVGTNAYRYSILGDGIVPANDQLLVGGQIYVNFTAPAVDSVYTYYLIPKSFSGCVGDTITGTVRLHSAEGPIITTAPREFCDQITVTLTSNCTGTVNWYTSDDVSLFGNTFLVSKTTAYYAKCTSNGCTSDKSENIKFTKIERLTESPGNVPITWTGASSNRWEEACNWSPGWVPDSTNAMVVIPLTDRQPMINFATIANIQKIKIEKGAILDIVGTLFVKSNADTLIEVKGGFENKGFVHVFSDINANPVSILDSGYVVNSGKINIVDGLGISLGVNSTLTNTNCGEILLKNGSYLNSGKTINNGFIHLPNNYDFNNSGSFTNNGILKAKSVRNVINNEIIVNNACPIFEMDSSSRLQINRVYSDSLLTQISGEFSNNKYKANPNLSAGTHRLYASISDNVCTYKVPFDFKNVLPDSVSVSHTSLCEGERLTLKAYCHEGTVTWYNSDTSLVSMANGNSFSFIPTETLNYWVACETSSCQSSRISAGLPVMVKPKPNSPVIAAPSLKQVCAPNSLVITSTGCAGNVLWSTGFTGPSLTLSSVGNYTISAKCIVDGCESDASNVIDELSISAAPAIPVVSDYSVCSGSNITLSAVCNGQGNTVVWFADSLGAELVNPQLINITVSKVYYAACQTSEVCQSNLVPVHVKVEQSLSFANYDSFANYVYGCENGSVQLPFYTSLISGRPYQLQWQILNGGQFKNLTESASYQNVNSDTLTIHNLSLTSNNSLYRVLISNTCNTVNSDTFNLRVGQLPSILTQPVGQTLCLGNQTIISVQADGYGLSYQWQVNTGNGFVNLTNSGNYSNVFTPNLSINNVTADFNNYQYRCIIFNSCQSITSSAASINIDPTVKIFSQPLNRTVCQKGAVSFNVVAANTQGGTLTYQWQRSTNGGLTYENISNSSLYSGVNTANLALTNIPANLNNVRFRCLINGYCQSTDAILSVTPIATVVTSPTNKVVCQGNNTSFSVVASGIGLTYRWQVNTGSGFTNINNGGMYEGVTEGTLQIIQPTMQANGYQYRCLVSGNSNCDSQADISGIAKLTVGIAEEAQTIVWGSTINSDVGASQASGYILGTNKIEAPNGKATYIAGQAIELEPGFEVEAGAVFEAKIQNACKTTSGLIEIPKRKDK